MAKKKKKQKRPYRKRLELVTRVICGDTKSAKPRNYKI